MSALHTRERTPMFIDGSVIFCPNLQAYWRDPAPYEAEKRAGQAGIDRLFAPHDARVREDKERIWALIEQENGL